MIPNLWYAILQSSEVRPGKPRAFRRLNEDLVVWRNRQGKVVIMGDRCPHRGAKLSIGRLVNDHLQCRFHGFAFDASGACQSIPANGRTGPRPAVIRCQVYTAQEAHGFVWLWYGEPRTAYPPLPDFGDLDTLPASTFQKTWDVHYSRVIESLLDVAHLPFVHPTTIGRGGHGLVNGPYTTLANNELRLWVHNTDDRGELPRRPAQMTQPAAPPLIRFLFPNVWHQWLGQGFRNTVVVAPVDQQRTVLYLRSYVRVTGLRRLDQAAAWVSSWLNRYILAEDERVVRTQPPGPSDLSSGDKYIPADRPIVQYHRHAAALMAAAGEPLPAHEPAASAKEPRPPTLRLAG